MHEIGEAIICFIALHGWFKRSDVVTNLEQIFQSKQKYYPDKRYIYAHGLLVEFKFLDGCL